MISVLLSIVFSLSNAVRGAGYMPKYLMCLFLGCFVGAAGSSILHFPPEHTFSLLLIIGLGMALGLALGWGKYFAVFTGNMATIKESEVKWIDWLVNKLLGVPQDVRQLKIWSFVAFTLRGIYFYPMFAAMAFFNANAALYGLGALSMGIAYGLMNLVPEKYAVRGGELLYGGILGYLVGISL